MSRLDHAARRNAVAARVRASELAGLWVTSASNLRYLTGFSGSSGTLVLRADGARSVLATDGRYEARARVEVDGIGTDVDLCITRDDDWLLAVVEELNGGTEDAGAVLGVEAEHLTLARFTGLVERLPEGVLRPVVGIVEELRTRKDEAELGLLARAACITSEAFSAMCSWLAPGMTERAIAHRLVGDMIDRGADGPAFDFIVAAGPGGAEPHHAPTGYRVRRGDLVTVDAGAVVGGYRADMTRTVGVGAPPPPALRAIYDVVARAQAAGVGRCRNGVPAADVDAACREVVEDAGHGGRFPHPTGHGVGLDVHEPPILHGRQVATLRPGMAVTVEPGIYVAGLGGVRIEDVVAVTDDGPRVLTVPDATAHTPNRPDPGLATPSPPDPGATPTIHDLVVV